MKQYHQYHIYINILLKSIASSSDAAAKSLAVVAMVTGGCRRHMFHVGRRASMAGEAQQHGSCKARAGSRRPIAEHRLPDALIPPK